MGLFANDIEVRSALVRSLYSWWITKRGQDIPDRSDLDPVDLKHLLPNLFIADVEHNPFRIRYRLVGTRAIEATGMDITGRYLDELLPGDGSERWTEYYYQAYQTRLPVFGASEAPTTCGTRFTYEFGLFPLRKGGSTIEQFVALEDYFDLTSTLLELVEWRERQERPLSSFKLKTV
jgi:hypothetical protein